MIAGGLIPDSFHYLLGPLISLKFMASRTASAFNRVSNGYKQNNLQGQLDRLRQTSVF